MSLPQQEVLPYPSLRSRLPSHRSGRNLEGGVHRRKSGKLARFVTVIPQVGKQAEISRGHAGTQEQHQHIGPDSQACF